MAEMQISLQPDTVDYRTDNSSCGGVNDRAWFMRPSPAHLSIPEHDRREARFTDDPSSGDIVLVMSHFAKTLGADGWAVMFCADQAPPLCLAAAGLADDQIDALVTTANRIPCAHDGAATVPAWVEPFQPLHSHAAFVIAIRQDRGDACILVNLVFTEVDEDERRQIERVGTYGWPPVAAYFRLWQTAHIANRRTRGIEAGLNLVAIGIVLLSADGHIVFANDAARSLIERHDGIREHRGQLQASNRADMAPLSNAIGYALAECGSRQSGSYVPLLTLTRENGPPLVASFISTPVSWTNAADNGALAFFVDPGLDIHQLAEPVCKLFHLSRVEAQLTCLLASGQTLAGAALSMHVKISTARGYLKQIFMKTGSNRQVDLVRLIFSNLVRTSYRSLLTLKR